MTMSSLSIWTWECALLRDKVGWLKEGVTRLERVVDADGLTSRFPLEGFGGIVHCMMQWLVVCSLQVAGQPTGSVC